jgi:hypothetical protein
MPTNPEVVQGPTGGDTGLTARTRRGLAYITSVLNSLLRSGELTRTGPDDWTIGGAGSSSSTTEAETAFPFGLADPGPGPLQVTSPVFVYHHGDSASTPGLTITYTGSDLAPSDAIAVVNFAGVETFSVTPAGAVTAAGSLSVAGAIVTVSSAGVLDVNVGPAEFRTGADGNVGVRVLQNSATQSANLLELTNALGTGILVSIDADGNNWTTPSTIAIGSGASAHATSGTALGSTTAASGSQSTAVGAGAVASGTNTSAFGINAAATGNEAVAIGTNTGATKRNAVAIGNSAAAAFEGAVVFGAGVALATYELVFGNVQGLNVTANFRLTGHSSVQARSLFTLTTAWADSTDASHTVRATLGVNDWNSLTTGREGIALESNGTGCTTTIGRDAAFQGFVVNEAGADADTRIEGDTATSLVVCDAGLDAFQVGTTTAGVLMDLRSTGGVFNEDGADRDYRIEGDAEANLLYTDAGNDRVGVGTASPAGRLAVQAASGTVALRVATTETNDDPHLDVRQYRTTTTDNTPVTITVLTPAADTTYLVEARVVARRTGGSAGTADDGAVYILRAMVTTKTGTPNLNTQGDWTFEDNAALACQFNAGADLEISVTGDTNNNYTWHATVFIQSVGS